jgi:hypothetical protein
MEDRDLVNKIESFQNIARLLVQAENLELSIPNDLRGRLVENLNLTPPSLEMREALLGELRTIVVQGGGE